MNNNVLLKTDVYKLGHMRQYPADTEYVYSYLEARKLDTDIVWFGASYYFQEYLSQKITPQMVQEFIENYEDILGPVPGDILEKVHSLGQLGYIPLRIKVLAEGSIVPNGTPLMTIENTIPGFHWCVGFFESLLLKVWATCSVARLNKRYYALALSAAQRTCDDLTHLPWAVHDFGYRGCMSEESAALAGAACLIYFRGSDNVPANRFIRDYYAPMKKDTIVMGSVPASEHSVMCSYGKAGEIQAFEAMLDLYPTGIVSIVSDTYDLWNVLTNFTDKLYDRIMSREGKVVFRPDSGDPVRIICGDPTAEEGTPAYKGALRLLWEKFGGTTNKRGYKVLDEHVGLIYGDGMFYRRYREMLDTMQDIGFASSNLVIGVGGLMLQNHSRDDHSFSLKATWIQRAGKPAEIFKCPVTGPEKKSKTGLLRVERCQETGYSVKQQCTREEEQGGALQIGFLDGETKLLPSIEVVRAWAHWHDVMDVMSEFDVKDFASVI